MIKKYYLCYLLLLMVGSVCAQSSDYQLKQVVMLSRHNLRAPLSTNNSILSQVTPKVWPTWDTKGGELSPKGGKLEANMGHYIRAWLAQEGLLPKEGCPVKGSVYLYANSLQRTVATAQSFAAGAFAGCDINVYHQNNIGTMDPVFNPVITNDNAEFQQKALAAIKTKLDALKLDDVYHELSNIIDYKDSVYCKKDNQCDLSALPNKLTVAVDKEPAVSGPLKIGNSLVDAFMLQYYQGFEPKNVAWGAITSEQQWQKLAKLRNSYQEVLVTAPIVAMNIARPLVSYISNLFLIPSQQNPRKLTVLVGHDTNIASVLASLNFKSYHLPNQYESTPIGGKLVFQRWRDTKKQRDLLKVEYIYQSTEQLREAQALSLEQPPQRVTMELKGCPIDQQGFCSWQDFVTLLKVAIEQ